MGLYEPVEVSPESRSGHNTTNATIAKGTIVKYKATGDREILPSAAATDALLGVAGEDIPVDAWGQVVVRGVALTLAGAALTQGAAVTSGATTTAGKAIAASVAGSTVLGIAREVGAADVLVEVELAGPGAGIVV